MTDDENKERSDLFGDSSAAKPLFGADESLPQGKPLFNNELDGPGDAAYVKPLFSDSDDEHNTLDDFQEFDNVPDTEDSADAAPAENPAPAESDSAADDAQGYAAEKNNLFSDDPSNRPFAEDLIPADTNPPAGNNGFVQESPEQEPAYKIPSAPVTLTGDLEAMSLGTLMAYAREAAGLSMEDVYGGTKINERYLIAIEQDQFDKLPSGAFPGAYVRALCSFYHLDKNSKEIAQQKAAAYCTECRPPDEVYDQLNEHAIINREEQEKFRKIVAVAGIVLFSVILSIITIIVVLTVRKNAPEKVPAVSPVSVETLEKLDPEPPQIKATELDVPR